MQRMIGSLVAAPSELLFFAVWTAASLVRPVILVTTVCLLSNPTAAYRKLQLFWSTIEYLLFCNDKKWKTPKTDPASFFPDKNDEANAKTIESKTVIFVRHGESSWNDTFNKGDRSAATFVVNFIPNLVYAVFMEWLFWVTGKANESWFFDAPLSDKGRLQAEGVLQFLQQDTAYLTPKEVQMITKMRGGDESGACSAQLVSSNLRRAIATMAIGFKERLDANYEKDNILILPALQEISRNPDALSITPPFGAVAPSWTDPHFMKEIYGNQIDTSKHTGNKSVKSNGLKRMEEFCRIAFGEIEKESIICGGHSLWFRSFFRTYLPHSSNHVGKKKKIVNGGVVGFTLQRIETSKGKYEHLIDPNSIVVLHRGF
jgi:hypothetical protein